MKKTVSLNTAKLDFDKKLDFSAFTAITDFTRYEDTDADKILERIQEQEIVITKEMPVPEEIIDQFPDSIKLICEAGTGFNNIDIKAARAKHIAVCNVPTYSTEAVATLAITFILNISASLIKQQIMLYEGNFDNFTKHLTVPHYELQGRTLGIVGGGAIGQATIKLALPFGLNILVYDPFPKELNDNRVRYASLEELLKNSDFISLHCPLVPKTKHLINQETLAQMKPTAHIINTSRGGLINEADLVQALRKGTIAGAALDVQDPEPPTLDNPLFEMENVIMTPHIGWKRIESRQRLVQLTAENILSFIKGKPVNIVN
jgi:glycerate dehydrogenase